ISQRRSAKEAVLMYEESAESRAKREQQIIQNREQRELFDFSGRDHKPNKKERRLIHRFKQG
ncbi:MAG: RNA-binding protein, partial [Methylobacter sp.]